MFELGAGPRRNRGIPVVAYRASMRCGVSIVVASVRILGFQRAGRLSAGSVRARSTICSSAC
jgi:hypothetical protein